MQRQAITPTLKPFPKQYDAFNLLWNDFTSYLLYGGGAGGGKSWMGCEWLLTNCYNYPGTRWFVGRKELTRVMTTVYVTWQKVCRFHGIPDSDWKLNGQYHYIEFVAGNAKGSRIDLLDLAYKPSDPVYSRLGSTEFTGGWIEEADEVDVLCFDILKTRIGRFMNTEYGLYPAKLLLTCNPSDGWLYRVFYKPFKEGTLPPQYAFIRSLFSDNPFTREHYGQQLSQITDDKTRARLRDGDWEYAGQDMALMKLDNIIDMFDNPIASGDMVRRLTGDIASSGGDKIVLASWRGWDLYQILDRQYQSLRITKEDIRSIAVREQILYKDIVLDEAGIGEGLVSELNGVLGFKGNRSAIVKAKSDVEEIQDRYQNMPGSYLTAENYKNLRTQCYYRLADKVNHHHISISAELTELQKQMIIEELQQIKKIETAPDAPLQIVSKDVIKEALGRSPDFADTLSMRVFFDLLKESPPSGVYNPPDEQRLRELGIESPYGGIDGYVGMPGFGLKDF